MSDYFLTDKAKALLASFNKAIDDGKITTWERDSDGDVTHKSEQWKKKAWLSPKIEPDRLAFYILNPKGQKVSSSVYAFYHGHMIETFLNHFDNDFTMAHATPLGVAGDTLA